MEALFTKDYWLLWMIALALALYFPVRQLIWVLYVRRATRRAEAEGGDPPDEAERVRLKARAGFTAVLISFVFAFLYTSQLFQGTP